MITLSIISLSYDIFKREMKSPKWKRVYHDTPKTDRSWDNLSWSLSLISLSYDIFVLLCLNYDMFGIWYLLAQTFTLHASWLGFNGIFETVDAVLCLGSKTKRIHWFPCSGFLGEHSELLQDTLQVTSIPAYRHLRNTPKKSKSGWLSYVNVIICLGGFSMCNSGWSQSYQGLVHWC